jgi:hypothetical protein
MEELATLPPGQRIMVDFSDEKMCCGFWVNTPALPAAQNFRGLSFFEVKGGMAGIASKY